MVGDLVYLKLQPCRLKPFANKINEKFSPQFYDPYKIIKVVGHVTYQVELLPDTKIHPIFHVSLLKKVMLTLFNYIPYHL